jgi:hypothetical protein
MSLNIFTDHLNSNCLEYIINNDEVEFVAVISYIKGDIEVLSLDGYSEKIQLELSNKLNIPYFIFLTYLEKYEIPMYFILPINKMAKDLFTKYNCSVEGKWFSIRNTIRFLSFLHKKNINEDEISSFSNKKNIYKLPSIMFENLTNYRILF